MARCVVPVRLAGAWRGGAPRGVRLAGGAPPWARAPSRPRSRQPSPSHPVGACGASNASDGEAEPVGCGRAWAVPTRSPLRLPKARARRGPRGRGGAHSPRSAAFEIDARSRLCVLLLPAKRSRRDLSSVVCPSHTHTERPTSARVTGALF